MSERKWMHHTQIQGTINAHALDDFCNICINFHSIWMYFWSIFNLLFSLLSTCWSTRWSYLVLFVLSCIWKAWNNGCDTWCRCDLTGINHNQHFHEIIIDFTRTRLNDVNIFATNRFANFNATKKQNK